jgi:hypothetical protein
MRLHPPIAPAPPLRWIPIAALPAALREAIDTRSTLEAVSGPLTTWWRGPQRTDSFFYPSLAGLVVFTPVFCSLVTTRTAALVAAVLAAMCAAYATDRPRAGIERVPGQGALLSTTSVVLVDHSAVAVIYAEHLEHRDCRWWYGATVVDASAHGDAWVADLEAVMQRARVDLEARADDPWRAVATLRAHPSLVASRGRHVGRIAVAAVAALALMVGAFRVHDLVLVGTAPGLTGNPAPTLWEEKIDLDRQAREGSEEAMRSLLANPARYHLTSSEERTYDGLLRGLCGRRFPREDGARTPARAIVEALRLACLDPRRELPVEVGARRCTQYPSGERCRLSQRAELRLRGELLAFLRLPHDGRGTLGPTATRGTIVDDASYLVCTRTESVTAPSPALIGVATVVGRVEQRCEIITPRGEVLGSFTVPASAELIVPVAEIEAAAPPDAATSMFEEPLLIGRPRR